MAAEPVERRWGQVARTLASLSAGAGIAIAGALALIVLVGLGAALAVVVLGLFLVTAALELSRRMLDLQCELAGVEPDGTRVVGGWTALPRGAAEGDLARFRVAAMDRRRWNALLIGLLVAPVVTVTAAGVALGWGLTAIGMLVYPAWAWAIPGRSQIGDLLVGVGFSDGGALYWVESAVAMLLGVAMLLLTPTVVLGAAAGNRMVLHAAAGGRLAGGGVPGGAVAGGAVAGGAVAGGAVPGGRAASVGARTGQGRYP